jgi:serine/threonine-protein kinase RsbW
VVNAVVHGNHYSARKKVRFQVIAANNRLTVVTTDEGEGFEVMELPDPLAEENLLRQSGRGMLLIRAFMDEVRIEPVSPSGTQVTMTKNLAASR